MAGTKISDLPSASTLTGAELVPVVQSDVTKKTTITDILTSSGAGTVHSVDVSGGTTGLTTSGGPITTSGTITLGGTLDVDNGGTGATTAADARTNLDVPSRSGSGASGTWAINVSGNAGNVSGTVAVANGGTGATTASGARTNLSAAVSGANSDITSLSGITGGIATADYVDFDTVNTPASAVGRVFWDGGTTLNVGMTSNVTGKVNESLYVYIKASAAITKGQVIVQDGAVGGSGVLKAKPAPTGLTSSQTILGIAAESIALNGFGLIQTHGTLSGLNTTGSSVSETWADGDALYYNPSVTGGLTNVKPAAPNLKLQMGEVINAGSGSSGSLWVSLGASSVLGGTDSNVEFSSLANGQTLIYNNSTARWENHTLTAGSGVSITNGAGSITINATGTGGTVTSVDVSGGSTGLTTSGGPVTGSGTITLAGTLDVDNGGTGQTSYTNGQLLIGNSTGNTLTKSTLTAGSGISITNGAGSITIAASGAGTGDVIGPASATDSSVVLYDGTTGKLIKSQGIVTMSPYTVTAGTFQSTMFGPTLDKGVIGVGAVFPVNGTAGAYKSYGVYQIGAPGKNASTSTIDEAYAFYNESGAAENTAVTKYFHYTAKQGTIVSGGSITSQTGFYVHNALIGATNNYGFVSEIPVGGTNWNIYASGDAQNYFAGNVGIGKNNPSSALDVKGTIRLSGSTSGYVGLAPAAAAGSTTYTLPSADGTSGQVLKTDGTGTLSWTSVGGTGTVTSVDVSGGTTGLTTSGGPVTGSGTITLAGTLGIANGGTGQVTQQAAINALAGAQTSGYYLRGNGTNVSMSAIQAGDVPTLNQNTTGSAGSVANALTINNSGTGDASGSTYNGSAAKTISYNSIGASPLAGSSSLTTVGTISSGTWQGSTIGVGYGGTGQTSYTDGQLLIGNSTGNTLTKATLTAGTGISITNGSGSITIAASGGGGSNAYAWFIS